MFREIFKFFISAACLTIAVIGATPAAHAAADFYKGKTISIIIGYPPGGGFDSSARLLIRHLARHIPGDPTIIPRNMPGAGSLIAANYLYNVAPKDGTEFGLIGGSVPFGPLWSRAGVHFDALKFNWIGSMNSWDGIVLIWAKAPVKSRPRKFRQWRKWIFCLTATKILVANQERR